MIYQHPLAYLLGIEGQVLLRAWGGEYDEQFVRARLAEIEVLLSNDALRRHPGVHVAQDETEIAYRQWAPGYDIADNALLELDLPFVDGVLATLPAGRAADVACGTGRLARRLVARGHDVIGIDSSADMLDRARAAVPAARFVTGDVQSLPLDDRSLDVLTNALALTHAPDLHAAFHEFARVLRAGGTAIVSDVHPDLVFLGSTVKASGSDGQALLATTSHRGVGDYLQAAVDEGFDVIAFAELPSKKDRSATEARPPTPRDAEIGVWRDWPWTLLDFAPAAAAAAWNIPSVMLWQLRRS